MGFFSNLFACIISLVNRDNNDFLPTRDRGLIARTFYYASFVMSRTTDSTYNDVSKKVIKSHKVKEAIRRSANEEMSELIEKSAFIDKSTMVRLEEKHKKRAWKILQNMRSCICSSLLRIAGWVLYKLLCRMLNTVQIHKGQIKTLRKAAEHKVPIIYLPMHRSHLDYILISFVLYMNNVKPPLVAAGDNLSIPFFGNLMRGLGAFFIKRKLDPEEGKKDHVYRAVLQSYMAENLREGHSLEFFIEGGRSRSGKACLPKSGLLSIVIDSVLEGVVEDVYIVPIGISYEKLMDGNFVSEQLGKPKVMESFSLAAKAIWSKLHSSFGNVRVDFCQPFSLKEYLRGTSINSSRDKTDCVACTRDSPQVRNSPSSTSLYGIDVVVSDDKRQIINTFAKHIVYDAFNNSALMSTQLLAFLLLNKFRKGATLHQMTHSMSWLREQLKNRRRDVGFSGDSVDVVRHACNLLGKELISVFTFHARHTSLPSPHRNEMENNNIRIQYLQPKTKLPHILELQYYSNACVSVFLLDSIVANALFATLDSELETLTGVESSNTTISREQVVEKSAELCNILQHEFVFAPPCSSIKDAINATIENFITYGIFLDDRERNCVRGKRFDFEDYEDDDKEYSSTVSKYNEPGIKVALDSESVETLHFYRNILAPLVESYWLAACCLLSLIGKEKEDSMFLMEVIEMSREKLNQGLLSYGE
ncbi:Glycerol-3-phosphate acyltransferase 1-like protein [Dinothrombium tinctorium]|uniref:Glycerol-3-phosphate acyltransferase 1-like protein n=1 Tax=Dinothrombium tinctorium TaxID=1965070 RepID=A0A3S3SE03_9ACAR|nr:Glycerol-3-phosphate acyltransferase 1-like protein [Dinothrombium tinctorium]